MKRHSTEIRTKDPEVGKKLQLVLFLTSPHLEVQLNLSSLHWPDMLQVEQRQVLCWERGCSGRH